MTIAKLVKKYGFNGLYNYLKIKFGVERLTINGIKNSIYLRRNSSDVLLFKQIFVKEEYDFHIPDFQPSFLIDAGANIGLSSLFLAKKFPEAKIISLEPEKQNYLMLKKNTINYPNITPLEKGLWSKQSRVEIISKDVEHTGFMVREMDSESQDSIEAVSVNDLLAEYKTPILDFLKLDIEGAEKEVLLSNTNWLEKTKVIVLELHDRKRSGCSKAFFSAFQKHDFECHPFGQNFLLINKNLVTN